MTSEMWDAAAPSFDDEADHGLSDPDTRAAWASLLLGALPPAPARIADLGCGTGTLTRLLTDSGHVVDGLDFSPAMIERATAKVPEAHFVVGDAAEPGLEPRTYDAVLSRHVLWALPDPVAAIANWAELLKPDGVIVLVEGRWHTGGGLSAAESERIVRTVRSEVIVTHLPEAIYWGKPIDDERYLLVGRR